MYHCRVCKVEYEEENSAKGCCTQWVEHSGGNMKSPKKYGKHIGGTHVCPNVKLGGNSWSTFIHAEGSCPMCDYVDLSR